MKTFTRMGLAALFLAWGAMATAAEEFSEVEYYKQLAEAQLAKSSNSGPSAPTASPVAQTIYYEYEAADECCGDDAPSNAFVVIPKYFNSRNSEAKAKMGGQHLKIGKSRANGMGVTTGYSRRVNDMFSFTLLYEYGFLGIRGGGVTPDLPGLSAKERSRWDSHVVGVLTDFNFGKWGRFSPSIIQGFDRGSGQSRIYQGGVFQTADKVDGEGTNVTSLMAWYEKDFEFCSGWKLTPYAGWRSLYVVTKSDTRAKDDNNLWVHLLSGGMKLGYQTERFGFNLRGGVSHRTSGDDVPGYGNRAVAPGVIHFSHRANLDKTVWAYGAGVNYAINKRAVVAAAYDGYAGKDTTAHMASLSFIFPF